MAAYASIGRLLTSERINLQQARVSQGRINQRLAELRAEVADLESEADALKAHTIAVTSICEDLLSRFLREFFGAAPDEVLLRIFEEVIVARDRWHIGSMRYEHQRAQAPFVVAAVCRRWRQLALASSVLWTYFGLPGFADMTPAHVDRITLMTKRSRRSPIDVVVDWTWKSGRVSYCVELLKVIGSLAGRFQRVEWATGIESLGAALEGLQGPTLSLTHLCVRTHVDDPSNWARGSTYLPYAPRLQSLTWDSRSLPWTIAAPCYTSLTVLTIWSNLSPHSAFDLLCAVSDVLEELNWGMYLSIDPGMHVELPRLIRLHLLDWDWIDYFNTSVLNQIATSGSQLGPNLHRSDTRFPVSTVTDLILTSKFVEKELDDFVRLESITKLTVGKSWYIKSPQGRLSHPFLSNAMARDPPLWPKLKHLHFQSPDETQPVHPADLVAFIRSRNTLPTTSYGDVQVSRIESVRLDYDAPEWLIQEVERLTVGLR